MTTHAHYAGEFGAQKLTKKLEKDPAYRAARAEHFAREAQSASLQHAMSLQLGKKADAAQHALVAAHAEKRSASHAKAAEKLAPGSDHARYAAEAHETARAMHEEVKHRESGAITTPVTKYVSPSGTDAKSLTKEAFDKTKKASDNPTAKNQRAASEAHAIAAKANVGDSKTVALHERMADHHRNRAETMSLDGTKAQVSAHDDKHLADVIHTTAAKIGAEGRFGDRKVFIHEVYKAMSVTDKAKFGTLDQFKDKVRELHKTQLVTAARADLVAAMNPDQVKSSHTNMEDVGHHGDTPGVVHTNFIHDRTIK